MYFENHSNHTPLEWYIMQKSWQIKNYKNQDMVILKTSRTLFLFHNKLVLSSLTWHGRGSKMPLIFTGIFSFIDMAFLFILSIFISHEQNFPCMSGRLSWDSHEATVKTSRWLRTRDDFINITAPSTSRVLLSVHGMKILESMVVRPLPWLSSGYPLGGQEESARQSLQWILGRSIECPCLMLLEVWM